MANPFTSKVGLKGVTDPDPAVLVNDLPGISTELVTALKNSDAVDAAGVWAKIQRLGYEKLRSMVEGELSKSADFRYTSDPTGDLMVLDSSLIVLPGEAYRGYSIRIPVQARDELYLGGISLDCADEVAIETTIKAFSATGIELLSKSVTVQPGYNYLPIDRGVASRFGTDNILFVGIDCSELSLRILGSGQCWPKATEFTPSVLGVAGSHALAFWEGSDMTCVLLEANIRRSMESLLTRYTDRLLWAYAHVCGSLLMAEKLGSSKVNLFTNTNRTFTEDREAKFMDEAAILVKPIVRDMLKELSSAQAVSPITERVVDQGYSMEGFV